MKSKSALCLIALSVLWGCSGGNSTENSGAKGSGNGSSDSGAVASPAAPVGDGKLSGKLEISAFKGGYDIDFYAQAGKEFQEKTPGLTVNVDGDPRVWEKLKPRMVSGDTPDLMFPGWGMDQWALVQEGQLMTLDAALDSPAYGGGGKWRDTFDPNILKMCQKDGKTYMLPLYVMVYGWWYDPGVFKKNGWTAPKTVNELMALCEKIKAKGIAPMAFQGQYPYYMIEGMLLPWAASYGGDDAVKAAQNLEPGAWKSDAMLNAAKLIATMRDKGYFLDGCVGMSHTESQTQFLNGKAAMVPCGSWISVEMKSVMPPGVSVEFFNCPKFDNGKGDPTAALIGVEPWMIPSKAKNPAAAVAFYKYMTSLEKAKQFVEEKGTLMSIKGSDTAKLPAALLGPSQTVKNAKTLWAVQYRQWYPEMQKEIEGAMTSLLNKSLTPEQFCDRCEAAAEKTRQDDTIAKYKLN